MKCILKALMVILIFFRLNVIFSDEKNIIFTSIIHPSFCSDFHQDPLEKIVTAHPQIKRYIKNFDIQNQKSLSRSFIRVAYFVWDTTSLPREYIEMLNENYDAVIVPTSFVASILRGWKVCKPIFILYYPLNLSSFLEIPEKNLANKPFIYGVISDFSEKRNLFQLVTSFHQLFNNSLDIKLVIHSEELSDPSPLLKLVEELKSKNVFISWGRLTNNEYIEKIKSFDCFISLSKRESIAFHAFESLAAGIPCILSNNSGHQILTDTGFVRIVPSYFLEAAYVDFLGRYLGCQFNCKTEDVAAALKDVYENYEKYLKLAKTGKEWVKNFSIENLKQFSYLINTDFGNQKKY